MPNFNGSSGDDIFTGGADNDTAVGNGGNDNLSGGGGSDLLVGNSGSDILDGGDNGDTLYSGDESPPFNFPYYGNPWTAPLLDTGSEVDTLNGGAGDDRLFAGYGDNVDGGTGGNDYLFISFLGATSGVTADFRMATQVIGGGTITGIENISWVQGSNYDDDINVATNFGTGYSDFTAVFGMGGNDRLTAGYYTGVLFGGDGNDIVDGRGSQYLQSVDGGDGDDTLYTPTNSLATAYGGAGNDTIYSHSTTYGGAGNDLIILSFSYYGGRVYGEDGDDEIRASTAGNTIAGGAGADILTGHSGVDTLSSADFLPFSATPADDMGLEHDVLTGFGGNDILAAGYGDDVDGGSGSDTLRYSLGGLASGISFSTAGFVSGQPFVIGGGTINSVETLAYLRGTNFADTLTLATQAQLLNVNAGDGDDVIISGGSSASILGGNGNDRFFSGIAGDIFDGGAGVDTADYRNYASAVTVQLGLAAGSTGSGPGGDQLINVENVDGTTLGDTISGSDDANTLQGLGGDDILKGFGGSDTLDGGTGADDLHGGAGNDYYIVDAGGDRIFETAAGGYDIVFVKDISYTLAAGQEIESLGVLNESSTVAVDLAGNGFNNRIVGNDASNGFSGGGGTDLFYGNGGNDFYVVDSADDRVIETAGDGYDIVFVTGPGFTLSAGSEVESIGAYDQAGTAAMSLNGNELDNRIVGNAGSNSFDGGSGADLMYGGASNDFYVVDNALDRPIELVGEGYEIVFAKTSYTLEAGQELESLGAFAPNATTALDLTGNEFANRIIGNAGSNTLDGGAGADDLYGGAGNDYYIVDNEGDHVFEAAGEGYDIVFARTSYALAAGQEIESLGTLTPGATTAIDLTGNEFANLIVGNAGANTINGRAGADVLWGEGGADTFAFTSALGGGNVDRMADIVSGTDKVALDDAVFTGIGPLGALNANAFVAGTAAGDADDRIVYDAASGNLYFDADGNGAGAQVLFATVAAGTVLAASDFQVI